MKLTKRKLRRKLVKYFFTYVCCKCGNVARGTPHKTKEGYCKWSEEKEKCRVCGEYQWRKCILDERK